MWNVIWTMPNKITVYARPLFRLVCRPNEIMTIGSARMQIKLRTHRYSDRDRYRCSCRYSCMGWCRYGYIGVDLLQPYVNYSILMSKLLLLWCFAKLLPRCMRCAAWLRQGGHQSLCCPDVVLQIYTNLSHCIARQQQMWAGNAAFTWQMRIFNAINDLAQRQTFCSALHTLQIGKGVQGVWAHTSVLYILLSFICSKVLWFPLIGCPLSLSLISLSHSL